ncbi:MAG: GFA family protein [Rhodospirillaceae bacterium]|jgi:hypothetical protein|nr:GFA family protein [Rhodospirillaceae bacterium]MBT5193774.1 GFA family protein [Rhodospirillaceae bacterium]MBT5897983.1 GFA family protein [Rhodospirillaceae bacterium]MBT6426876.1 GFA family protein [Rhodospirillaceae bacterium]MBT7756903.1 GFA family protein [Rhodospirillaceae bacterium]
MTKLTGGCLCGAIRFEITGEPMVISHCHCGTCRKATGAPFITWITLAPEGLRYIQGTPAIYRSSDTVRRTFCANCGTTLGYAADGYDDELDISAAALDEPGQVVPDDHIWSDDMLPWFKFDDGLPRLPGSHWEHGYPDRTKAKE